MGLFDSLKKNKKENKDKNVIEKYGVIYKGGHPDYPKSKSGKIEFIILEDKFQLKPTTGTKSWFDGLEITYNQVEDFRIVDRDVSTVEAILGGLNSKQLNQSNNLHIKYIDDKSEIVLRLEMLSGVTVMGQAIKCKELEDRLRNNNILEKLVNNSESSKEKKDDDITGKIEKLAKLRDKNIITEEEFSEKKKELLDTM